MAKTRSKNKVFAKYVLVGVVTLACTAVLLAWIDQVGVERTLEWVVSE